MLDHIRAQFLQESTRFQARQLGQISIETDEGIGIIGPHENDDVPRLLSGTKPLLWLDLAKPLARKKAMFLEATVAAGLLKQLYYQMGLDGADLNKVIFFQPHKEADAYELLNLSLRLDQERHDFSIHQRIGELLGYTKADIAAFQIHLKSISNRLDPAPTALQPQA